MCDFWRNAGSFKEGKETRPCSCGDFNTRDGSDDTSSGVTREFAIGNGTTLAKDIERENGDPTFFLPG